MAATSKPRRSAAATTMLCARLHGPCDLRVERRGAPKVVPSGSVLIRIASVGICGSDLHVYLDGRIGDQSPSGPVILGHEFSGWIESAGRGAVGGAGEKLRPGMLVAVDPAQNCGRCEMCRLGQPNLCLHLRFCGLYPDAGALQELLVVPGETCFALPASYSADQGALLETLGVAVHALDLGHVKAGQSAAVVGAGAIGLCLLQTLRAAGADPVYVCDRLEWRLALARKLGGIAFRQDAKHDAATAVAAASNGRGVDVAYEAAWSDESVQLACRMTRMGGRVVLVGIPSDNRLTLEHATARRKGLTLSFCRRMKHTYPRALRLVESGRVDLSCLVSHRFGLQQAAQAFEVAARYQEPAVKVMIDVSQA